MRAGRSVTVSFRLRYNGRLYLVTRVNDQTFLSNSFENKRFNHSSGFSPSHDEATDDQSRLFVNYFTNYSFFKDPFDPEGPNFSLSASAWWAWEDLNFRPHAYQARALTN